MELTAIVVTYNSADHVAGTLDRLETAVAVLDAEILVVDNGSADATVGLARKHLRRGRVIANHQNLGFGGGVNVGLRHATGARALIMNDDAWIEPEGVARLMDVLDSSSDIGLVGPRIVAPDGSPMHAAGTTFPGLGDEVRRIKALLGRPTDAWAHPDQQTPTDVSWLVGACVMGRTEVLRQVGGFNELLPHYGEDVDLGRRLRAYRLRSVTVPSATCVHIGAVTGSRVFGADDNTESQEWKVWVAANARDAYHRLWTPRPLRMLINLSRAIGTRRQPDRLRHFLPKAIYDGKSIRHRRLPPAITKATETSIQG